VSDAVQGKPESATTDRIEPEAKNACPDDAPAPTVSEGSLVFKEHLERLSELVLILLIGGTLFLDSWSWRAADEPLQAVPQGSVNAMSVLTVAMPYKYPPE